MSVPESPVQRIEREKQAQIEKIKAADSLVRKIHDLDQKREGLNAELNKEVQRLMTEEGFSGTLLKSLGLPVPRQTRKRRTATESHVSTDTRTHVMQ